MSVAHVMLSGSNAYGILYPLSEAPSTYGGPVTQHSYYAALLTQVHDSV